MLDASTLLYQRSTYKKILREREYS